MIPFRARVENGRLVLDEPTTLPEGTVIDLVADDEGDDLTDEQTTHHYANLYRQLRKQGRPIPTNDMWIAALVLQHSLMLYDRDVHFDALPQLTRV